MSTETHSVGRNACSNLMKNLTGKKASRKSAKCDLVTRWCVDVVKLCIIMRHVPENQIYIRVFAFIRPRWTTEAKSACTWEFYNRLKRRYTKKLFLELSYGARKTRCFVILLKLLASYYDQWNRIPYWNAIAKGLKTALKQHVYDFRINKEAKYTESCTTHTNVKAVTGLMSNFLFNLSKKKRNVFVTNPARAWMM
jgi:hypothetical protein